VLIASGAISLYLVFWPLGNLANVPSLLFAISNYDGWAARQPRRADSDDGDQPVDIIRRD
jgi:hypothetical protein